jgi:hypothetical protein
MKASRRELPVAAEMPEGVIRQTNWGEMTVEAGEVRKDLEMDWLFKGLPADSCQCPHWGYVLKGRLHYKFSDHEEVFGAGELYYVPPGHTPFIEAGCEYVEFSPTDLLNETMEVVERNMRAQL